jgi:hypothetical protein
LGLGLGVFKKSENEKVGKGGKIGHRPICVILAACKDGYDKQKCVD